MSGMFFAIHGGVAQLGERLLCKQEAIGSIPFTSTTAVESCAGYRYSAHTFNRALLCSLTIYMRS
jgi:hypothetical protein